MELEGRYTGAENLAEILRGLSDQNLSGTLVVKDSASATEFQFYKGKLIGSGNQERPRRLGQILLSRGLVDRAALEEALAYQADFAPGTPLGKVLVFRERITQDALRDAIKLQLEEELWEVLAKAEGNYRFDVKNEEKLEAPLVELNPAPILTEILARQTEWDRLKTQFYSEGLIPAVVKLSSPADRETLHFTKRDWQILSLINGYYDIGCIAARSGLGRFESYRVLSSLLSSGVIELRKPVEPITDNFPDVTQEDGHPSASGSRKSPSTATRWSGLLARIRENEEQGPSPADHGLLSFDSPVSFVAAIVNTVISKLMVNPDFIVDPSDERLVERHWRQVLMTYPKADLVKARHNHLDPESFDRYIRSLGVQGPMKSIYLETMEALNRFLRVLHLLCVQRLGARTAKSLFVSVMDDLRQRSTIRNSDSFFFKEFAARIIE